MTVPYDVKLGTAQPAIDYRCHCEGAKRLRQSPGRQYRIATFHQEIPTGFALGMTDLGDGAFAWRG